MFLKSPKDPNYYKCIPWYRPLKRLKRFVRYFFGSAAAWDLVHESTPCTGPARSFVPGYGAVPGMARQKCQDEISSNIAQFIDRCMPESDSLVESNIPFLIAEFLEGPSYPGPTIEFNTNLLNILNPGISACSSKELASPGGQAASNRLTPGDAEKPRLLFVTAHFPSILHAGGLRVFDMISILSKDYQIDLVSTYREETDGYSRELIEPHLFKIACLDYSAFTCDNVAKQVASMIGVGNKYAAIHYEWLNSAACITQLKTFTSRSIYTFMECDARRVANDLHRCLKEGRPGLSSLLCDLMQSAKLEIAAASTADVCVFVSEPDMTYFQRLYPCPEKCMVVTTGISKLFILDPISRYQAANPKVMSTTPVVLFIGYFDSYTNVLNMEWYIKQVHPLVRLKVPNCILQIVGKGDTSSLRKLAEKDSSIVIVGEVADLAGPICESTICISPIISGAGFRGKINQYSAGRKATVSTALGVSGLKYVDGESVMIADSPESFADCVIRLLQDGVLRERIVAGAGKVMAQHYTWETILQPLCSMYR
jgi:glycosyltransferase involved in cell wall biosynthesis